MGPWSDKHIRNTLRNLDFFQRRLKLQYMSDLDGRKADIEQLLTDLIESGAPQARQEPILPLSPGSVAGPTGPSILAKTQPIGSG